MDDVLALHGFAGTGRSWDDVARRLEPGALRLRAPDLPGHGASSAARPVDAAAVVTGLLAAAPERFVLCGYSLGGRLALRMALAAPERVERLVLVATTAGLEDDAARRARRHADEALALGFAAMAIDEVAEAWARQPLFAADPDHVGEQQRAEVRRNDPVALAAVLRGLGAGTMAPVWDRLDELTMPAVVLAGERDERYVAHGRRLAAGLPAAAPLVVVPGAGHGLLREAPAAVAEAIAREPS